MPKSFYDSQFGRYSILINLRKNINLNSVY